MEFVNENDFVEIEYTGRLKEEDYIFDTTSEKVAKENGLFNPNINYGPLVVCAGKGLILKGLDKELIGKELGFEGKVVIDPQDAFGKKDSKLLKLIPASKFKSAGIKPQVGLQVDIDGMMGFIKTVTGGRVIVDFNHPLSGKELVYNLIIKHKVSDKKEQVSSLLTLKMNLKKDNFKVEIEDEKCNIELVGMPDVPDQIKDSITEFIKECTGIKEIYFLKNSDNKN